MSTINIELLLRRKVVDVDGETIGRLEEIIVEVDDGDLVIREFHTGAAGFFEHASATLRRHGKGYIVLPEQIDLRDSAQISVNVRKSELRRLGSGK